MIPSIVSKTIKGQIVGGSQDIILVRQKSTQRLEIGELVIAEYEEKKVLFQVIDLKYASQVPQQTIEYVSGMDIEQSASMNIMDKELRYYTLAELKSMLVVEGSNNVKSSKSLVPFFTDIRTLESDDVTFLTRPKNPLFLGSLRSGSKEIPCDVFVKGDDALSHHILIAATTGRGKSNFTSCMLWSMAEESYAGMLVLDPHDEYYGRNGLGLKDHPHKKGVAYYTPYQAPSGASTLAINIALIKPEHFQGALSLTDAQRDAMYIYYRTFKDQWISKLLLGLEQLPSSITLSEVTIGVLRRKIMNILSLNVSNNTLVSKGIFTTTGSETLVDSICTKLEESAIVIIDTSHVSGSVEILVGSMISHELFSRYRYYKMTGQLINKPVIGIVLEEAPRVIGVEALREGPNIFASIAREGRKFKIGLVAITQLPSLIPKEILANMNTKIILGIEMASERQAIIESAAQDLSSDSRNIASLDKGEAIVTSTFCRFAMPIKIPLFSLVVKKTVDKTHHSSTSSHKESHPELGGQLKKSFPELQRY